MTCSRNTLTVLPAIVAYCGDRGGITNRLHIARKHLPDKLLGR
ncbi:MAG: hypothetical protein V7K95_02755 [Nostoc sp.]